MTLERPTVAFFNAVINHAEVRPTVEAGAHRLDASAVLSDVRTIALTNGGGIALFLYIGAGHYEGHVFCLPGHRGAGALALGKAALRQLFALPDARKLSAPVPLVLPAARLYCRKLGLRPIGRDLFQEYFLTEASEWAA